MAGSVNEKLNDAKVKNARLQIVSSDTMKRIIGRLNAFWMRARMVTLDVKKANAEEDYKKFYEAFASAIKISNAVINDNTIGNFYNVFPELDKLTTNTSAFLTSCGDCKELCEEIEQYVRDEKKFCEKLLEAEIENVDSVKKTNETNRLMTDDRMITRGVEDAVVQEMIAVTATNQSGYGYIYDTVDRYIAVINKHPELLTLAGDEYPHFVHSIESWKERVKTFVDSGRRLSSDNIKQIDREYERFAGFVSDVNREKLRSGIFDDLLDVIRKEYEHIHRCYEAHDNRTYGEVFAYKEIVKEDTNKELHNQKRAQVRQTYNDMAKKHYSEAVIREKSFQEIMNPTNNPMNAFMLQADAYEKDGVKYSGKAYLEQIGNNKKYTFGEIARNGNAYAPLYAAMLLRGYRPIDIESALRDQNSTHHQEIMEAMKDARKQVFDLASLEKVEDIEDQLGAFYAQVCVKFADSFLNNQNNHDTIEDLLKFTAYLSPLQSALTQGIPTHVFNKKGEPLLEAATNDKLAKMGKPYKLDNILQLITDLGHISFYHLHEADENNELPLQNVSAMTNQLVHMRTELSKLKQGDSFTENSLAAYQSNLTHLETMGDNEAQSESALSAMRENLRLAAKPSDFHETLLEELAKSGASELMQKVERKLYAVCMLEKYGTNQHHVNGAYTDLKKACVEYLESRNPWTSEGKKRYDLVAKIECMVDDSREARMRKEEQQVKRDVDKTFVTTVNDFLAETDGFLSSKTDSKLMAKIKNNARVLAHDCTIDMQIPVYSKDHCWYKLFKNCMEYVTDPKKADNSRKGAVNALLSRIVVACKDPELEKIYRMRNGDRAAVLQSMEEYQKNAKNKLNYLSNQTDSAAKDPKKNAFDEAKTIQENYNRLAKAKFMSKDAYIQSIFGMEAQGDPTIDGNVLVNDTPQTPFTISDEALNAVGLNRDAFSYLALMEFVANQCIIPGARTDQSIKSTYSFMCHICDGNEIRENNLTPFCKPDNNTIQASRDKVKAMIENHDMEGISKLLTKSLKFIVPDFEKPMTEKAEAGCILFKKLYTTVLNNPNLPYMNNDALRDAMKSATPKMNAVVAFAEACEKKYKANIEVCNSYITGNPMTAERMRECYKDILKQGVFAANIEASIESPQDQQRKKEECSKKIQAETVVANNKKLPQQQRDAAMKRLAELNRELLRLHGGETNNAVPKLVQFDRYDDKGANHEIPKGRQILDKGLDSLIPENLTMGEFEKLVKGDKAYYAKECKNVLAQLEKQLQKELEQQTQKKSTEPVVEHGNQVAQPNQQSNQQSNQQPIPQQNSPQIG